MQPEGKAQLLELLRTATVLIANCRPGALERKGLGYETLHALNPGLIYCSISSYGQQGPRSCEPGYDLIIQGESGLMAVTGEADGEPMPVGSSVVDVAAGMYCAMAILAALRERDRSGEGQYIHISLLETALTLLANIASGHVLSGDEAGRYGSAHPSMVPFQSFRTRDGHMTLACGSDSLFERLCHALGRDELATDERFITNSQRVTHRDELVPLLQECLLQRDTADWLAILHTAGVPCGPIKTVGEALQDPQVQALGSLWSCQHATAGDIQLLGSPLHLSKTPPQLYKAPPRLGEDNDLLSLPSPIW
jgi:crotonobetainyl-CoA:carnitine CoA-transferase CaiB-like acyl-CoA transferase